MGGEGDTGLYCFVIGRFVLLRVPAVIYISTTTERTLNHGRYGLRKMR